MQITELPVKAVIPSPDQPRKKFRKDALQELSESITANGLIQPITVRPVGGGRYQIVAGERRWRAHELAGALTIRAIVVEMNESKAFELAMIENIQRDDMKPSELAAGLKAMMNSGYSAKEVGAVLGKRPSDVTWYVKLDGLAPEIKEAMDKGIIGTATGWQISRLEDIESQRQVFRKVRDNGVSAQQLGKFIDKMEQAEMQGEMFAAERSSIHQRAMDKFQQAMSGMLALSTSLDQETLDLLVEMEDFQYGMAIDQLKALEGCARMARVRLEEAKAHRVLAK